MPSKDRQTDARPTAPSFDCVIPAAGYSSRMGTLKSLVSFRGRPLLISAVMNAAAVCDRVIVVTGYRGERVREALENDTSLRRLRTPNTAGRSIDVVVVANEDYDRGMVSSIACGASHVTGRWFFVAPGDMPIIDPAIFRILSAAVPAGSPDARAIFPVWKRRRGHPVLIDRRVVPNLLAPYRKAENMRTFLDRYPSHLVEIGTETLARGIFVDIDTPDDLARTE